MNEFKSIIASRTVWGAIIAIASALAGYWGYSVSEADAQELAIALSTLGTTIGSMTAIGGRIKATKKIGKPE